MSNALAIAAVTAVFKAHIEDAVTPISASLGGITVSAIAPDRITTGNSESPRLNLYFYGVTPNQGWWNSGLPSRDGNGSRLTNPPLALDLHYLITAYGQEDFQAEVLLGYAMQRLHEVPQLERNTITSVLSALTDPDYLVNSDLAEQVEVVKITPKGMNTEEISKLWSAFQSSYRPSAAYMASVVLIEETKSVRTPLPVLTRGPADIGPIAIPSMIPPYPSLSQILPQDSQPSARLGETIQLRGHFLAGTDHTLIFAHPRLDIPNEIEPLEEDITPSEISVTLPDDPASWPVGIYTVYGRLQQNGVERETNELPMVLAPLITDVEIDTAGSTTTFTIEVSPEVLPEQSVLLVVGDREVSSQPHETQTDTLTFEMEDVAAGDYYLRLRIDGVESILIDRTTSPPTFDSSQQVTIS